MSRLHPGPFRPDLLGGVGDRKPGIDHFQSFLGDSNVQTRLRTTENPEVGPR